MKKAPLAFDAWRALSYISEQIIPGTVDYVSMKVICNFAHQPLE